VVSVFSPDSVTLIEEDDDDGTGNGRDATIESLEASLVAGAALPAGGTYYARVRAKDPAATIERYSMLVALTLGAPVAEVEPNEPPFCQPLPLSPPLILATLSSADDVDCYRADILDNGFPLVIVDGDPERDGIGTDATLAFQGAGPVLLTDSSGTGGAANPPSEGFAIETLGDALVTGTGAGTYVVGVWWSGECPIPVELQSFAVE
jgi:hypothetical protein